MTNFEKLSFCSSSNLYKLNAKNIRYNNKWKTEAIKNRIHSHCPTTFHIIDVPNKLNKNLYVISFEFIGILTFLLCISSDTETNSLTWLKMYTPISNLKLKEMVSYLILSPLSEKFGRVAFLHAFIHYCGWGAFQFH